MGRLVCGIVLLFSAVCFAHQHYAHKSGSCPIVPTSQWNSTASNSTNECSTDASCPSIHKCCIRSDGVYRCTHPIFQPATTPATPPKSGSCPIVPTLQWNFTATNECSTDSSCPSIHKCCVRSDGVYRCTHPIFQPATTAATPKVVKDGRCPFPYVGEELSCSTSYTCTSDSDCSSSKKCCLGFIGQDCSICRWPIVDYNQTTTTRTPTRKPYRYQPGVCPENFNRYYGYGGYASCPNNCNDQRDCDEGELCCVPGEVEPSIVYEDTPQWKRHAERHSDTPVCPVCKKAEFGCQSHYGVYYQNKEVYQGDDECTLCQCFEGYPRCYQVCNNDYGYWRHWHSGGWFPAGILSGVSLLISVIFSLSLCCCMKACCNGKKQAVVVPQVPPAVQVQAQPPPQFYYMAPATEDKIPLTDDGVSTA